MENQNQKIYPQDYSDKEILKTIEQYADGLRKHLRSQTGVVGPSYYNSYIELGYYELSKRNQERFLQQVERLNKENEQSGKISYRLFNYYFPGCSVNCFKCCDNILWNIAAI